MKWKEGGGEYDCRGFKNLIEYDVEWKDKAVLTRYQGL